MGQEASGIRINKYLSEVGHCSRRAADKLLEQGRITLNGVVPELGTKVMPGDTVEVDGKAVGQPTKQEDHVYIAYHKPVGIVCTTDRKRERDNIIDAIGHEKRIFPVGRLDKPSEGLIFLTSDGDIVNKVLRARNHHEKEYHVTVDRPIRGSFVEDMAGGVPILGTVTRRCEVEQTGPRQFRIVLTQGLNRQIRRMCEHLGYNVVRLKRVRIMHMHLDVARGEWRDFSAAELRELHRLVDSSKKPSMTGNDRPIVVGGGAAGLAACLTLESQGHAPILLEASDRLGGRLRTDRMADGTPVDVGFQVLLTAYPELQRWVDLPALDPVAFVPGARIRKHGRWKTLADPRRLPGSLLATLTSGVGTWGDRIRILKLVREACSGSAESVQNGFTTGSTAKFLRTQGFTDGFIRDFLGPFFSGIFLDDRLSPPPAQFLYTLRMFASGAVVRPAAGIDALVHQLTGRLERTEVRLGTRVAAVAADRVELESGEVVEGSGVISSIEGRSDVKWNSCFNAVFDTTASRFGQPIIGLLPEAESVTNVHFMEDVQGEEGRGKLNVTALPGSSGEVDVVAMEHAVRRDLEAAGLQPGAMLWHTVIHQALPQLDAVRSSPRAICNEAGVHLAGDHVAAPSLDAALRSGRLAAEFWMAQS